MFCYLYNKKKFFLKDKFKLKNVVYDYFIFRIEYVVNYVYLLFILGNGRGCDFSCWFRVIFILNFIWVIGVIKFCIFMLVIYFFVLIY